MSFTSLSAVILSILVLTIFKYSRKGYKTGLSVALIGLAVTLFSVFFAAVTSIMLVNAFSGRIIEYMQLYVFYYDFTDMLMGYSGVLDLVFKMLFTLVIYVPVFYILRGLVLIPVTLLLRHLCPSVGRGDTDYYKEGEEFYIRNNRAMAIAVGAMTGFLISIVCLTPLAGGIRTASAMLDFAEEVSEDESIGENEIVSAIYYYSKDYSAVGVCACGGRMLFNFATTVGSDGDYTDLNRELAVLSTVDISELEELVTMIGEGERSTEKLRSFTSKIEESKVLEIVFIETVSGAAEAWLMNEDFMGVSRPEFGDYNAVTGFIDELLLVCMSTDSETIAADLETLINVSGILTDNQELFGEGDYNEIISVLVEDGLLNDIKTELSKNPHMNTVLIAVDHLVMSVVAEEIQNYTKYSFADAQMLYGELAEILTSTSNLGGTVRVTAVTESVKESLAGYGVYVPEELNEQIASQLINGVESYDGEVSVEQVRTYFENFLEQGGDISDLIPAQ